MPNATPAAEVVRFGNFEVDLRAGHLRKRGLRIRLPEQSFQVLALLLEHAGDVVSREELRRRLWPEDVFVEFDANLNTAIARLREALNDSANHPRFIETLPRRGYRFLVKISESDHLKPRLLVLPFDNLSGDPGKEYFSDGLTEDLISALANTALGKLGVLARSTAMYYKGRERDVARIAQELGVDYVVEGAASRVEDRVCLTVHLIRAADRTHLWTNRYDTELRDLFKIEIEAVQSIVREMGIVPLHSARKPTRDPVAYNFYIQGRHHRNNTNPEGFAKAQHCFKAAIARDPEFALAYDALAELQYYLGFFGFVPPREALSVGLFHALRAIEIDRSLAETHALLGHLRKQLDYDWAEVNREMHLALELNPASPLVRLRYAMNGLMPHGYVHEAIAEIEKALEVDPLDPTARTWLGAMCWLSRQYDRGLEELRKLLAVAPTFGAAYFVMGQIYGGKGHYEEAIAAHQKATDLSGGAPLMLGWAGIPLGKLGRVAEVRSMLESLHDMAKRTYVPPTAFAWVYLGLGDIDNFFKAMDRAVDARDHMLTGIKSYWSLDELRSDPRYLAILRRMNLKP